MAVDLEALARDLGEVTRKHGVTLAAMQDVIAVTDLTSGEIVGSLLHLGDGYDAHGWVRES